MAGADRFFPRRIGALEEVFRFVGESLAADGIGEPELSTVSLVVEEIFTNLVKYNRSEREIAIRIERKGDRLLVHLTDFDVDPFDPTLAPAERPATSERREGGFGLRLVRRLADSIAYEYVNRESRITIAVRVGA